MQRIIDFLIYALLLFGLYGTFGLAQEEWTIGNICPLILGIPACYIILTCFLLALVSHTGLVKDKNRLYFLGAGLAWSIATFGSAGQFLDIVQCPKTTSGIPMCYISFALFSSLLVLKLLKFRST